jgi:hypothetical protein
MSPEARVFYTLGKPDVYIVHIFVDEESDIVVGQ